MNIDVSDIVENPGASKELHVSKVLSFEGLDTVGPVQVDLRLVSAGKGELSVTGRVQAKVSLTCSRCAGEYVQPLEVDIEERFVPQSSLPSQDQAEEDVDFEDLCVFGYENSELDTGAMVRENLLASLPYRPLCRPDCRGVCPQCGQNLNEGACKCGEAEPEVDPRWSALKNFSQG